MPSSRYSSLKSSPFSRIFWMTPASRYGIVHSKKSFSSRKISSKIFFKSSKPSPYFCGNMNSPLRTKNHAAVPAARYGLFLLNAVMIFLPSTSKFRRVSYTIYICLSICGFEASTTCKMISAYFASSKVLGKHRLSDAAVCG